MRTFLRSKVTLLFMTCAVLLAIPTIALADDLRNNLDGTFEAAFELLTLQAGQVPAQTQTVNIVLQAQGSDGDGGCNIDPGEGPITVKAISSNSSVASVKWVSTNTDTVNFTDCAAPNSKNLLVTAGSAGSTNVTFEITNGTATATPGVYTVSSIPGGGTYDVRNGQFTVNVTPPPNTPPSVSVTGVTHGAIYDKGAVPAAGCTVVDAEDTGESATPETDSSALDSDGLGSETVTCSYTDGGGLTTVASATYTIRDPSGPVITKVVTPAAPDGDNDWYKSNVTVVWTVSDPQSPNSIIKTGCVDQNITTDQPETTYTCSATSAGGSAPEQSVTIKRDGTAPTIDGTRSPGPNANGWNNESVTVSYSCADNLSGVASCGSADLLDTEGANQSATGSATDAAGNTADATVSGINIDLTKPVINASAKTQPGGADYSAGTWTNKNVEVSFSCSDELSDVDTSNVAGDTKTASGADQSVTNTGNCTDKAGNTADSATFSNIDIDKDPPTITGSRSPGANADGWNNESVTVHFDCADQPLLSDLASCTPDQTVSAEGANQSATGTATDNASNTASTTVNGISIDKTAPNVQVTGVSNGATYTLGSVPTAGCSTTDSLSDVKTNASLSVTGGPVGSVTAKCDGASDKAGNTGSASVTYNVNYNWSGFRQPVDNLPTLNTVKAGQSIPMKFSLSGNQGLNILQPSTTTAPNPKVTAITCPGGSTPMDAIEQTTTANNGLTYDATADQYNYVWKTQSTYTGKCYRFDMQLIDGTTHSALFKFSK